jgi:hypothetical protein
LTIISPSPEEDEKTELLYGVEAAVGRGVQFMKNVKTRMDLYGEKMGLLLLWSLKYTETIT